MAAQAAIQELKAVLQAARAGVAAITAPGTVPKTAPAAEKQAATANPHPVKQIPEDTGPASGVANKLAKIKKRRIVDCFCIVEGENNETL